MLNMKVTITTEYITLGQFLKLARIIQNGGDAKIFLLTTAVYVNGELEQRRGRKLRPSDIVKVSGKEYEIIS
jgi:S4 domain protein YaaA